MQDQRRGYAFLYLAYLISQIGNWAFRIGILVGLLQSSTSAVGIGVAVIFAPIIFGSLCLSPLADRWNRLSLMIGIDLFRAAAMIPFLFGGPIVSLMTYLVIASLSLTQPVFMSAQTSYLRSITPTDNMVTVLRNITNIDWSTYIIGMAVGAFLVENLSLYGVVIFNAATFIASAVMIGLLKRKDKVGYKRVKTEVVAGRDGHVKPSYLILSAIFFLNLGAGIINIYPAIRANAGDVNHGMTLSSILIINGLFGLVGALLVKSIYNSIGALRSIRTASGVVFIALVIMAFGRDISIATIGSSLMLGAGQVFAVSAQTLLISSVDRDHVGKISGLFQCCTYGGVALNGVLFSTVASSLNFNTVVALCAASAFVALLIALKADMPHGRQQGVAKGR